MRILFCGGGTAGHVYPNIAISQTLRKNVNNVTFAYVVTERGIENSIVDFEKYKISAQGLSKDKFFIRSFTFLKKMLSSIEESKRIINDFNPDIVIGTGGFGAFPVIYAGAKLGVKTLLLESNLVPGKAIKCLEKKVDRILVNYEESIQYFSEKHKVLQVGNPVRLDYQIVDNVIARENLKIGKDKRVIVSFGGSLGAKRLNDSIIEFIDNFFKYDKNTVLFFITGKKDYTRVKSILKSYNLENVRLIDFSYNLPEIIASADIVISRAGAMTISELSLTQKCSILVPSPNVANNHQYKNAKMISEAGGAILITEDKLYSLTDTIKELLFNHKKREEMQEKIKAFSIKDSNKIICFEILRILNNKY